MNLDALREWWEPLGIGFAAVLVALLAYRIVRPIVVRLMRRSTLMTSVTQRLDRPLHWVFPLIALQLVWQGIPDELAGIDRVRHLNGVLLIIAFTAMVIGAVRGVAEAVVTLHPQDVADNLQARRIVTQTRVLSRIAIGVVIFAGTAFVLMTFPKARQLGASLLASAGVSALVIGLAAKSVFGNLLAGLQIALTQPIRIDDVLIVENEWGRVEEITSTYVVMKIWDERRLVIPLQYFIEHPFQNWTRTTAQIIGSVFFWVDYTTDLGPLRTEATRLAQASKDYDGRVCLLQVVDTSENAMKLRLIVSSQTAGQSWDLQCAMREGLIELMQRTQPEALPRVRAELRGLSRELGRTETTAAEAPRNRAPGSPWEDDAPPLPAASTSQMPLKPKNPRERAQPELETAGVNNDTGMASLTAPTGGRIPKKGPLA